MRAWAALLLCACEPLIADRVYLEDMTIAAGLGEPRGGGELQLEDRLIGGVCVIDADGSGPLDLFFTSGPTAGPSRLFVAREAWAYSDETIARGLGDIDAVGCLAIDADGDRDDDLIVTGVGAIALYEQMDGAFTRTWMLDVPASHLLASATAADWDGDGDLDLAVAGFIDLEANGDGMCGGIPCALDLADAVPVRSYLLRRIDDGYEDATLELAPELAIAEPTLVLASPDANADGTPDLYVGNDLGARFVDRILVRGEDGVLRDESARLGLAYDSGGTGIDTMGWTTGDVDGDGRFDHAVTTFEGLHSPIFLCEREFCEDRGHAIGTRATRHTFRWGNALADLDLDGDLDLFEATGHLFTAAEGRLVDREIEHEQSPNLLLNDGTGSFSWPRPRSDDALSSRWPARGLAIVDLDDDGSLDVVLGTTRGPPAVLRNVSNGHWLRVVLDGRPPNTGAIGALVRVYASDGMRQRQRLAGEGFLGNFDPRLHIGLPSAAAVDVEIVWPSGSTTIERDVAVDRELVVVE